MGPHVDIVDPELEPLEPPVDPELCVPVGSPPEHPASADIEATSIQTRLPLMQYLRLRGPPEWPFAQNPGMAYGLMSAMSPQPGVVCPSAFRTCQPRMLCG